MGGRGISSGSWEAFQKAIPFSAVFSFDEKEEIADADNPVFLSPPSIVSSSWTPLLSDPLTRLFSFPEKFLQRPSNIEEILGALHLLKKAPVIFISVLGQLRDHYAFANSVSSSRLCRKTFEDLSFQVLCHNLLQQSDFRGHRSLLHFVVEIFVAPC